ncbi:MAG: hypothetical protein JXA14_27815 [Anaerolineae bacterium]|nr:hypothetical protein [Anaerolineae bacterium]
MTDYGKPLKAYQGSGTLQFTDGEQLCCHFDLGQVASGELYAICQIDEADVHKGINQEPLILYGRTEDGRALKFEDIRIVRNVSNYSQGTSSRHVIFRGKQATVDSSTVPHGPVVFSFLLTNLTLLGTEAYALHNLDGSTFEGLQTSWELDNFQIAIRRTRDYEDVIRSLKATHGVDVTCEAMVSADSVQQQDAVLRVVDALCVLLTLARGCRVEWISYDVVAPDGKVLTSFHRGDAITKPFGTLELIAHQPPEDTFDFISKTYPNLDVRGRSWQFREAVNLYTDAKSDQDFFELRGLKMVIIMEHLKGCYLRQHGKTHILKPKTFDGAKSSLVNVVRWTLPALFPEAREDQLDMMANHAQGFNWYPFRRAISDLCASTGLDFRSSERGRFVNIRNELVHRVEYSPEHGDSWAQYCFLMTFVGKVLLAILGYDGHFYDWTTCADAQTKSDMRTKLELDLGEATQG